jgi:hypothetical protein
MQSNMYGHCIKNHHPASFFTDIHLGASLPGWFWKTRKFAKRLQWFLRWRRRSRSLVSYICSYFFEFLSIPAFPIDDKMIRIWERMHSLQTNVPIFSIDGGLRDELIEPDWTRSPFALHASSTEIDDVWLETDHQCIVWCNQFVR